LTGVSAVFGIGENVMVILANILVAFVALEHIGFLTLEMFFWTSPTALRAFNLTPEFAKASQAMAANQGLYNGFLAAGLFWGLLSKNHGYAAKIFFLSCAIVAGIYGALTVKMSILYVQALPAAVALALVWISRPRT
jgi:putative membrane protein